MKRWLCILALFLVACTPQEDTSPVEVFFCPQDNCSQVLTEAILEADTVACAFYDLRLSEVIDALQQKKARVVIDNGKRRALMHNKFCILDNVVVTGSMNPTINGATMNNNNLLIIHSKYLAKNYRAEFEELWHRSKHKKVEYPVITLNNNKVENYFCPEDHCEDHVIAVLKKAKRSIIFMTFSFTADRIGDTLVELHEKGIQVQGIMEQKNPYDEFEKLKEAGIAVIWHKKKGKMHHKVFIIDNKIVVTGSYNPTKNGNEHNDENMLIMHDAMLAEKYVAEFSRLK